MISRGLVFLITAAALAPRYIASWPTLNITAPRSGGHVRWRLDSAAAAGGTATMVPGLSLRLSHGKAEQRPSRVCLIVSELLEDSDWGHSSCMDVELDGTGDLHASDVPVQLAPGRPGWYHIRVEAHGGAGSEEGHLLASSSVCVLALGEARRTAGATELIANADDDDDNDGSAAAFVGIEAPRNDADTVVAIASEAADAAVQCAVRLAPVLRRLHDVTMTRQAISSSSIQEDARRGICLVVAVDRLEAFCIPLTAGDINTGRKAWEIPGLGVGLRGRPEGMLHTLQVQVAHDCSLRPRQDHPNAHVKHGAAEDSRPLRNWSDCASGAVRVGMMASVTFLLRDGESPARAAGNDHFHSDTIDDARWATQEAYPFLSGIQGFVVDAHFVGDASGAAAVAAATITRTQEGDHAAAGADDDSYFEAALGWRRLRLFLADCDGARGDDCNAARNRLQAFLCTRAARRRGSTPTGLFPNDDLATCAVVVGPAAGSGSGGTDFESHRWQSGIHDALDAVMAPDSVELLRVAASLDWVVKAWPTGRAPVHAAVLTSLTASRTLVTAEHLRVHGTPGFTLHPRVHPRRVTLVSQAAPAPLLVSLPLKEGLGNRLRAMASAQIIAEETNRRLVVGWAPSAECAGNWNDLFREQHRRFYHFPLPEGTDAREGAPEVDAWGVKRGAWFGKTFEYRMDSMDTRADFEHLGERIVYVRIFGAPRPLHLPCDEFLYRKSRIYQRLAPVGPVLQEVRRFEDLHFARRIVIGVHVRGYQAITGPSSAGDPLFLGTDWPVVAMHPGTGPGEMVSWAEASPLSLFHDLITGAVNQSRKRMVFLATNDKTARQELTESFAPQQLITWTPADPAGTKVWLDDGRRVSLAQGARPALIDWLLLSRTAMIMGSYCSSFSHEAAVVHLRERVQVRVGGHLLGESLHAPECRIVVDAETLGPCTMFMESWGLGTSETPVFCEDPSRN